MLDPGGLVTGCALDRALSILDSHGARNYVADSAGDVVTRGESAPGEPWRIGTRHPGTNWRCARVILGGDLAVATSRAPGTGGRAADGSRGPQDEQMAQPDGYRSRHG